MSHNADHTLSNGAEDGKLNRLVRAAVAGQSAETPWPGTETILAYLHGEGSDKQRRDVQEAIAESAEFRRFLVDTAHQIEELNAPELIREFDAIQPRGQMLPGRPSDGEVSVLERIRTRLTGLVKTPVLVPALAAAAILVIGIALDPLGWFEGPTTQLHAYAKIDPSIFTSSTPRGSGTGPEQPAMAESAYDAALNELRQCVTLDFASGEFLLRDNPRVPDQPELTQTLTLNLIDETGMPAGTLSSLLPHDLALSARTVQVWILFVPSTNLWQMEAHESPVNANWNPTMGQRGSVTFTYPTESGFLATPGKTFVIQ